MKRSHESDDDDSLLFNQIEKKCKQGGDYDKKVIEISTDYLPQENVVANGDLGVSSEIDIRNHTKHRPYCYVPPKFESSVDRYVDWEPTTQLLFSSGRNVTVGSKSPEQTFFSMHRQRFDLWRDHIKSDMCTLNIVNMVYVFTITSVQYLDIAKLHRCYPEDSVWTPSVFPGMFFIFFLKKNFFPHFFLKVRVLRKEERFLVRSIQIELLLWVPQIQVNHMLLEMNSQRLVIVLR